VNFGIFLDFPPCLNVTNYACASPNCTISLQNSIYIRQLTRVSHNELLTFAAVLPLYFTDHVFVTLHYKNKLYQNDVIVHNSDVSTDTGFSVRRSGTNSAWLQLKFLVAEMAPEQVSRWSTFQHFSMLYYHRQRYQAAHYHILSCRPLIFELATWLTGSLGSVGGIATGCGLDGGGFGVRIQVGSRFFFLQVVQTDFEVHLTSYPMSTGDSISGVKRPGREVEHSPPGNAEWIYTSTPPCVFMA
jgi:hypothetical protein